jgi:translation initiation factor 1 (eIF-1/SUI1)
MNKNVTKIFGLEAFIPAVFKEDEVVKQIHGFAHQLQLKFASSATVQNLPGKNAGREIVIQGSFVEELEALLMTEFDIKKDCITTVNKLGKKKKH